MLISAFEAGPLAANCYVIAAHSPGECLVIDPGQRAAEPLRAVLKEHELRPAAVLVTHGHFDHVASAAGISEEYAVDVYLGGGDVPMLTGQHSALSAELRAAMAALVAPGEDLDDLRPARLTPLAGGEHLRIAGLGVDVLAVPGHTPGSITYRLRADDGEPDVIFTGDTLFAGTVGRTDLPGGSSAQLLSSIATQLLTLPDDTVVAPGHGPASTIGDERAGNPFLRGL